MDQGIAFESSRLISKKREEKRIARERVLNQVWIISIWIDFVDWLLVKAETI